MITVTAIIPAYNEEHNIGAVLDILTNSPLINEIVVVSDGSEDQTAKVAAAYEGVEVIELLNNRGKGGAVKAGLENSCGDLILILDADLIGLQEEHVELLLQPVISGRTKMTTGLFEKGRPVTDLAQKVAPFLSGQRALKRELLENVSDMDLSRFGLEVALQRYIEEQDVDHEPVQLPLLSHVMKEEKLGFWKGVSARAKMYWEIIRYVADNEIEKR
jgi:polyisoprenyl-phosphate glycosyltransferase